MSGSDIRETLGFLGVMASLVFVGFEIRQNTLASRAAAIQESTNVARQQVQMYAMDADATRIEMIGRQDLAALSPEEAARFRWMMASFFWGMQGLHRQWDLGVLPDEEWQAWNTVICGNLSYPGTRETWESFPMYTPGFRAVVDAC